MKDRNEVGSAIRESELSVLCPTAVGLLRCGPRLQSYNRYFKAVKGVPECQ